MARDVEIGATVRRRCLPILLLLPAACGGGESAKSATPPAPPPVPVVTAEVRKQTVPYFGVYTGRTEAVDTVDLVARVEGFLVEAAIEEGKPVKKGQVLFRIERELYEANVEKAKAALARAEALLEVARQQVTVVAARAEVARATAQMVNAQQDVKRLRPLAAEQAVPVQDLDSAIAEEASTTAIVDAANATLRNAELTTDALIKEAEAQVRASKADLAAAELDLSYTTVASPIDGVVGEQQISTGNVVGRAGSELLATVSSVDPMRVKFSLPEEEFLKLEQRIRKEGEASGARKDFEILLADGTTYAHKGTFLFSERGLEKTTGTLPIVAEFPNPDGVLRPELFVRVRAQLGEYRDAVLVPQRAVVTLQSMKAVYLVGADGKVALRAVTILDRDPKDFIVTAELAAGDRIVLEGHQKVRPGMTAVAKPPESAEPPAPKEETPKDGGAAPPEKGGK